MATPPSRKTILSLYSTFLRTANSFSSYNFRLYFVRSAKDRFRAIQTESDPEKISTLFQDAVKDLSVLRRSALINQMYAGRKLVVEEQPQQRLANSEALDRGTN